MSQKKEESHLHRPGSLMSRVIQSVTDSKHSTFAGLKEQLILLPEYVIPVGVLIQLGPSDDEHLLLETCRGVEINTLEKECIKLVIN